MVAWIAKKENIALRRGGPPKLSAEKQAEIIKALKAKPNASEVARQIGGISSRTVARLARKADIELAAGRLHLFRPAAQSSSQTRRNREFVARHDAPPAPNERLRRTMTTPAPWEEMQ
jgi:hypothetical protein